MRACRPRASGTRGGEHAGTRGGEHAGREHRALDAGTRGGEHAGREHAGTRGGLHAGREHRALEVASMRTAQTRTAKSLLTGLARNMSRRVVEMQGTIGELSHFDVHKRDVKKRESLNDSRFA